MGAQLYIFFRLPQKFHDLAQLLLFLVGACHIAECHFFAVIAEYFRPRLTKTRQFILRTAAHHAAHHVHQQNERQNGQHIRQQKLQPVGGAAGGIIVTGDNAGLLLCRHQLVHVLIKQFHTVQVAGNRAFIGQCSRQTVVVEGKGLHLFLLKKLPQLAVSHIFAAAHVAEQIVDEQHGQYDQQHTAHAESSSLGHSFLL